MNVVMRSKHLKENSEENVLQTKSQKKFIRDTNILSQSPRTPSRKYKTDRMVNRWKSFWASYNNFILCNRSIELRITKLFSFQNTQYIVAFSKDFFEHSEIISSFPLCKKVICYKSYYAVQLIKFNVDACISEMFSIEHLIDYKMLINCNESSLMLMDIPLLIDDEFSCRNTSNIEIAFNKMKTSYNERCSINVLSLGRKHAIAIKITILILSFCVCFCAYKKFDSIF